MRTATNRKSDTQTPVIAPAPVPLSVIAELLQKVRDDVVRFAPGSRDQMDQAVPKLLERYPQCSSELRAALEASLNGLLARLSAPDGAPADLAGEIAALCVTCGELSVRHRAPGQNRLGIRLGGKNEPGTSDAETIRHAGEPARELVDELDTAERTFAERLAVCLKRSGVSQSELAAKLGVRPSAVSMMLRRPSRPQPRTVARIAAALNVTPTDLWPPARPPEPVTDVSRLRASELARLPRAVWEPILAAAAASVAAEYRADPESAAFDAFVFEAQYIDGGRVPPRASELLRWPAHLRDYYLTEAASQVAAAYRADPETNAFEAFQHESEFLD